MPNKPLHPCSHPGCINLTREKYCDQHKKTQQKRTYDTKRGTASQRGYDFRWQQYRISFLRIHPLCAECERNGIITPASIVDHIRPHKGDMKLFWDKNNHQSLCEQCHNIKTASEDGGFGNKQGDRG